MLFERLQLLQPIVYGTVALFAFIEWRRRPGRASALLLAAFVVLAAFFIAEYWLPEDPTNEAVRLIGKAAIAALVLFPFFLYRFMLTFLPPIRWFEIFASVSTFVVGVTALALPDSSSAADPDWTPIWVAGLLIQWLALTGRVVGRMWHAGRGQPAVARRRMRTMSLGAAGLAVAAVLEGELSSDGTAATLVQLLALGAAPLLLVGFAPPEFLRALWRKEEVAAAKVTERALMAAATPEEVARTILPQARKLLGATEAVLETEDGRVIARDRYVDPEIKSVPLPSSKRPIIPNATWDGSILTISLQSLRLKIVASPFTPFFGREEVEQLENLAALADLALSRNAIAENERRLASIVESSDDAILSETTDGIITSWNRGAQKIYGYEASEMLGQHVARLVPNEHTDEVPAILNKVRSGESIEHYQTKRLTKDGRTIDVSVTISPLRDSAGNIVGASTIARDITESKRLQEELHEAKKVAEEANLAKSEFLSRMSHELRTPLNAILGFSQLLELDPLSDDQRESTEQIIKGGRRLLELIDEVLDISRIETGNLRLSLEPVPVERVVRDATELIRPLAEERGLRLHVDVGNEMRARHVRADQQRLGQVLLNLLSNAVKYNVDHGTVSITALGHGEDRIRIGVTDTGPGIPDEKIPLLFTPFERLGAEQSQQEGTGLGLTLSKNLIETMGGSLKVDTMTGHGTTFWVELEAAEAPTEAPGEAPAAGSGDLVTSSGTVLYIEDNLSNLTLIERLLARRADLELMPAMTGALGIELAQQHGPDLIFLDLHLPDLLGDEVLIRLRKDPRTRAIPVVVLSADATPGQIKRLRAAGADDYLTKPIDVIEFMSLIDRFLATPEGANE